MYNFPAGPYTLLLLYIFFPFHVSLRPFRFPLSILEVNEARFGRSLSLSRMCCIHFCSAVYSVHINWCMNVVFTLTCALISSFVHSLLLHHGLLLLVIWLFFAISLSRLLSRSVRLMLFIFFAHSLWVWYFILSFLLPYTIYKHIQSRIALAN